LQIPFSVWPSNLTQQKGQSVSKSTADDPNTILFANNAFHRQAYTTHGVLGGYDQNGQLSFGQFGDTVYSEWFGTYYSGSDQAAGRVTDAVSTLASLGMKSQDCYLADQPNCHLFVFPLGLGPGQLAYIVYASFSSGNGVGELAFLSAPSTMVENTDALGDDFRSLLAAGDKVLVAAGGEKQLAQTTPAAPQSPSISAGRLDVLHIVRGRLKKTKTLHLMETGFFFAYFLVTGVGTYSAAGRLEFSQPDATLNAVENGKTIYTGPAQMESTPNGALFFDVEGSFDDPTTIGHVSMNFSLMLGTFIASETTDITVTDTASTPARRRE